MTYCPQYDNLAKQQASSMGSLGAVFYRMMKQESGNFDCDVVEGRRRSSAGALGIAQFMPQTAAGLGVNPLDPPAALAGAAAYLQQLIASFGGDVSKGVAAYNAGPGTVQQAVASGGPDWTRHLPAETQSYLQITQPTSGDNQGMGGPLGGVGEAIGGARDAVGGALGGIADHLNPLGPIGDALGGILGNMRDTLERASVMVLGAALIIIGAAALVFGTDTGRAAMKAAAA